MTTYIFDLRRLVKPMFGKPIAEGRPPRPHFDARPSVKAKREAARTSGGIDRVLVHHWGVEVGVHDALTFSDAAEAWALARRAAGLDHFGLPLRVGGAPYHVSVGCTSHGSGVVALVWPREAHTYHASTENRRSIGVGVMGRFHRDEGGDPRPGLPESMAPMDGPMDGPFNISQPGDEPAWVCFPPGSRRQTIYGSRDAAAAAIGVGPPVLRTTHSQSEGKERPGLPEAMSWALHLAAGLVRDPLDDLGAYLDSVTTELIPAVRGADAWLLRGLPLHTGAPPVLCTTHSQSANKPHDPGLYVVRHGIAPAVRAGLLTVEPEWHTGGGRQWPDGWLEAMHDA